MIRKVNIFKLPSYIVSVKINNHGFQQSTSPSQPRKYSSITGHRNVVIFLNSVFLLIFMSEEINVHGLMNINSKLKRYDLKAQLSIRDK